MIPSPPPFCLRHEGHEPECRDCEAWDQWARAFNEWLLTDEAGRWMDLNEFETARWEQLTSRSAA